MRVEAGEGRAFPGRTPTRVLHTTCTDPGEPGNPVVLDDIFNVPPGGGFKTYTPDVGWVCSVDEEDTVGASSVSYSSSADPTPSRTRYR